jgi:O-antigen ligase
VYTFLLLGISYFIENKRFKYFILLICACNFYPIIFSYSRAAYTSTLAGFLILGLLKDRKFLGLLVVVVLFYSFILPTSVVERINMTFLDQGKVEEQREQSSAIDVGGVELDTVGRKELWEKAERYFKEEPLFGIGFDTFRHREGMITHSMFMKILAEQGLIGIIIFIIFTGMVLQQSYKLFKHSKSKIGQGIGLGFLLCEIVHLVGSLTGDQSLYYNLMAIYWLFLGIVASFNKEYAINSKVQKLSELT